MSKNSTYWSLATPKRGPLCALADLLLLLLALFGTVFSAVSLYGIPVNAAFLAGACLLFAPLLLILYSLPRFRSLALTLALLCLCLAVWQLRETLRAGTLQIAAAVSGTLSEAFPVGAIDAGAVSGAERRALATLTLTFLTALLAFLQGWDIVRARSASLTFLSSAPLLLPALLAGAEPDWPPFLALVCCYCLMMLTSFCGRHDPNGGAKFTFVCLPVVALLLIGLALLLPQGGYAAPAWAEPVRTGVEKRVGGLLYDSGAEAFLGGAAVDPSIRLDAAGPRRFTGQTVMTVTSDEPGRVYLRGVSAARYTSRAWEPLDEEVYESAGLAGGKLRGFSPLNLPALTVAEPSYRELTIDYGNSLSGCLYTPYQLASAPEEIMGVEFHADDYIKRRFGVREKNVFYLPDAAPLDAAPPYSDTYLPKATTLYGEAAAAESAYRDFVYDNYLDVPEDFYEAINRWADTIRERAASDAAFAERLTELSHRYAASYAGPSLPRQLTGINWYVDLLALTTEYDLDAPYTPADEDFVDYFLNTSRRGYCVHYATTATLIFRAAGFPARYVEGYTANIPPYGRAVVKDSAAHAWVEVYLDGYGWYPYDATPSSGTGIEPNSALGGGADLPEDTPDEPEPDKPDEPAAPRPEPEKTPAAPKPAPEKEEETSPPSKTPLWLALAALALLIGIGQAPLRRALRRRKLDGPDTNAAVLEGYVYLERLRKWGGEIPPEALELAEKARFSQHVLSEAESEAMIICCAARRQAVWDALPVWKRPLFLLAGL